jgi:release factor glutamine methyltransferase
VAVTGPETSAGDVEHTVLSVLRGAEAWLERRGVEAPKRSAELLLGKVLGLGRLQLYLAHDRPLDPKERATMRALVARRGEHEPVAHLLGSWSFRGIELEVGPAVLIPRPETEELVELALQHCPTAARIIDLGTGSGAIAIAIAKARTDVQVVAVEQSPAALAIARANVQRHGLGERIRLLAGSWWREVPVGSVFDLVVSNPPYIDPGDPQGLAEDVRRFEPEAALFTAPGDPVSCYRAIGAELAARLAAGGWFVAETGGTASAPALQWLQQLPGFDEVALRPDQAALPRFLVARRQGARLPLPT